MTEEQTRCLESLFRTQYDRLVNIAMAALKSRDLSEEVVQDAFYEAARRIDALTTHPNPVGWITQTVKFKIKAQKRTQALCAKRFLSLSSDPIPSLHLICENEHRFPAEPEGLWSVVKMTLTSEKFRLFRRIRLEGASHAEVAAELGISVGASQKRLERIGKKLSAAFAAQDRRFAS